MASKVCIDKIVIVYVVYKDVIVVVGKKCKVGE